MAEKENGRIEVRLHELEAERDRLKIVLKYFSKAKTRTPKKSALAVYRQLTNIIKREYKNNGNIHVLTVVDIDEALWKRARGIT